MAKLWPRKEGLKDITRPRPTPHVYLQIYERDEQDAIDDLIAQVLPGAPKGSSDHYLRGAETCRHILLLRRMRFLRIYKGFVEGDLDLSGRHPGRWEEYIGEFEEFMRDFSALAPVIQPVETIHTTSSGQEIPIVSYGILREGMDAYRSFAMRWDIEEANAFLNLSQIILVYKLWERKLEPKFQRLNFLDLPGDVLDLILEECAREDLFSLSMTCKAMDWVKVHCLREMTFILGKEDMEPIAIDFASPAIPQLLPHLIKSRDKCVERIRDKRNSPHECHLIRKLWIDLSWNSRFISPGFLVVSQGFHPIDEAVQKPIFEPIYEEVRRLLEPTVTPRLSSLSLTLVRLHLKDVRTICQIETLQSMSLFYCSFTSEVITSLMEGTETFVCNVKNLHLKFNDHLDLGDTLWHALCFCPVVRNLSLLDGGFSMFEDQVNFPEEPLWSKFQCIHTLERLSLTGLHIPHGHRFIRWVLTRRGSPSIDANGDPNHQLNLTHFKISNARNIPDQVMYYFIWLLRSDKIKAFTLDAVESVSAGPYLIERLAEYYPNVESLKVTMRASDRQRVLKPAVWPGELWEYAEVFEDFRALRHFGWNHVVPMSAPTPAPLLHFERLAEDGGEGEEDGPEGGSGKEAKGKESKWRCTEDELFFDDYHLTAAAFAASCPTLKTFVSNDLRTSPICEVVRDWKGRPVRMEGVPIRCLRSRTGREDLMEDDLDYDCRLQMWPDILE
ncbi:hypothetical protein CC1G_14118 [Coprinopsis cinerea okayama7|uniref:F-box domain-containing protein n=1 Tax=Coprinopsis cinerea (strain Okayama-7 / 130 / ATCC MYA-4618 / FGSC 9003) TaxID=240176 RepID=D6RLJ9_COPC7|nr:hypothetical protein CC1G_14118 [Coprinopsis cinerea okayama7\|eukprot:XP_002911585.1 hypothetical protein CC1G_14118 [Coprinopsis cinerea okayama7\